MWHQEHCWSGARLPLLKWFIDIYIYCNVRYLTYLAISGYLLEDTGQVPGPPPTLCAVAPHRVGQLRACVLTVLYTSFIPAGAGPPHVPSLCNRSYQPNTYWAAAIHNNWKIRDIKLDWGDRECICVATPSKKLWCCAVKIRSRGTEEISPQPSPAGDRGSGDDIGRCGGWRQGGISANCCHQDRDQTMTRVCRDHAPCGRSVEN